MAAGNGLLSSQTIVTTIQGQLIDEKGAPVQGAIVSGGSGTATSDANGFFRLSAVSINQNGGPIKVIWPGPAYFVGNYTGIRNLFYKAGATNFVQLQKVVATTIKAFESNTGGSISIGPAVVAFSPNSFIKAADSSAYSGDVYVYAQYQDPSVEGYLPQMPGNLYTVTGNNTVAGLEPYGLVYLYIIDGASEILALAKGAQATLQFPAVGNLSNLNAYSFDSTSGFWHREAKPTLAGNMYTLPITHLSTYSLSAVYPVINYNVTFQDPNGHPLANYPVEIIAQDDYYTTGYCITDSTGNATGKLPSNQSATLLIHDHCGGTLFSKAIGPYATDANLGTISVPTNPGSWIALTGTLVDCNNVPLPGGYILVNLDNHIYRADATANGVFTLYLQNCSSAAYCSLTAYNATGTSASSPVPVSIGSATVNLANIIVCSAPLAANATWFNYSINGVPYNYSPPSGDTYGQYYAVTSNPSAGEYTIDGSTDAVFDPNYGNLFFNGPPQTGKYPFGYFNHHTVYTDLQFKPYRNTSITISEFGGVNQYISGTYSDSVLSVTDSTHVLLTGSFRVLRAQ